MFGHCVVYHKRRLLHSMLDGRRRAAMLDSATVEKRLASAWELLPPVTTKWVGACGGARCFLHGNVRRPVRWLRFGSRNGLRFTGYLPRKHQHAHPVHLIPLVQA